MKIIIAGPAVAHDAKTDIPITDEKTLRKIHGLLFSEYSCLDFFSGRLAELGLQGGEVRLIFDESTAELSVVTEYASPRALKPAELRELTAETEGQWSDGIGEGEFMHTDSLGLHVDVSPFSSARKVSVTQFDDGIVIEKPKPNYLAAAIGKGDEPRARQLILKGADLNRPNKEGLPPLHSACLGGLFETALLLIEKGAAPNTMSQGNFMRGIPLVYTAMCNCDPTSPTSVDVAKALLAKGVPVDATDGEGYTALMFAVNREKWPLMEFLLERGADINACNGNSGKFVIMYTLNLKYLQYLLDHGADPHLKNRQGEAAWEYALRNSHIASYKEASELLKNYRT